MSQLWLPPLRWLQLVLSWHKTSQHNNTMMTMKEQRHVCGAWGLAPLTVSSLWVEKKRRKFPGAAGVIWFQGHFSVFLLQLSCSSLYLRSKEMSLDLVLDFSRRSVPRNTASEKGDFWDARTLPTGQTKCSSSMFDLRTASITLLKLRLNGVLALTSWHQSLTPLPHATMWE